MMIAITVVIAVMILIIRLMKIMMIAIADDCGYDIDHQINEYFDDCDYCDDCRYAIDHKIDENYDDCSLYDALQNVLVGLSLL